jgi:phage host-nuclease inhibitor protein Gam
MAKNSTKVKARGANLPVPQTRDEASEAIAEIGRIEREVQRIDADLKDRLAEVKAEFEALAQPLKERREALKEGLLVFCEGRRDELTQGGRTKTVVFAAGKVSWKLRPPSVGPIRDAEGVLAALRAAGLTRFIRVKEEVNKEAILDDPGSVAGIPGLKVGSGGEDFTVEPFAPEGIEEAAG